MIFFSCVRSTESTFNNNAKGPFSTLMMLWNTTLKTKHTHWLKHQGWEGRHTKDYKKWLFFGFLLKQTLLYYLWKLMAEKFAI